MTYGPQTDELRGKLVWLGVALIFLGMIVGLWAVTVVYSVLHNPDDIPLLSRILDDVGGDRDLFTTERSEDGFTFAGSDGFRGVLLLIFLLFMFGALGGIVSGFISGGAKIISVARATPSAGDDK